MNTPDLTVLVQVTDALYRAEVTHLQQLVAEENRLREALARLDAQCMANRSLPEADLDGLRQIGGDMIWQGWVGRKRAELLTELAHVLGRKGQRVAKLRRAFGKAQTVERMASADRAQQVKDARAHAENTRAQLGLLDGWISG
jgi:hypothetical protein